MTQVQLPFRNMVIYQFSDHLANSLEKDKYWSLQLFYCIIIHRESTLDRAMQPVIFIFVVNVTLIQIPVITSVQKTSCMKTFITGQYKRTVYFMHYPRTNRCTTIMCPSLTKTCHLLFLSGTTTLMPIYRITKFVPPLFLHIHWDCYLVHVEGFYVYQWDIPS